MHYLRKTHDSRVVSSGWQYPGDAKLIREALLAEQRGFCAYSEKFVQNIDSYDVEHFDSRLKGGDRDGYMNWYAVLHWMNSHKPRKIEPFLPMLQPHDPELRRRIAYENGQFFAIRDDDLAAKNLIRYLGWNRPELATERSNWVSVVRELHGFFGDDTAFLNYLREKPVYLSFISALTAELGFDFAGLFQS